MVGPLRAMAQGHLSDGVDRGRVPQAGGEGLLGEVDREAVVELQTGDGGRGHGRSE